MTVPSNASGRKTWKPITVARTIICRTEGTRQSSAAQAHAGKDVDNRGNEAIKWTLQGTR
jgi:hypothetical protein